MKKSVFVFLCLSLALSCLFIPANIANASTGSIIPLGGTAGWEPPFITPITGDKDFTVQTLDPITLHAGIVKTEAGLVVPAGFPQGERQFGGEVLKLMNFESGTARVCFYFPNHRYGWSGSIYQWTGTRWAAISSKLTEGIEGGSAKVCADVFANGTYALITSYTGPAEKSSSKKSLPPCPEDDEIILLGTSMENEDDTLLSFSIYALILSHNYPDGALVRYSLMDISPSGSITGALTRTGKVMLAGDWKWVIFLNDEDLPHFWDMVAPPEYTRITMQNDPDVSFTLRVTTPDCYRDFDKEYVMVRILD